MMVGLRWLVVLVALVVCLGLTSSDDPCRISGDSSKYPYLVRIFECRELNPGWLGNNKSFCLDNNTLAHGALVGHDKVLTTCTWILEVTPPDLTMRIYNNKKNCVQERYGPFQAIKYPGCDQNLEDGGNFAWQDMALLILEEPFAIDLDATVWGAQWGGIQPPKFADVRDLLLKFYDNGHVAKCNAVMFSNASAVDSTVMPGDSIEWIPWKSCLETIEKFSTIDDSPNEKERPLRTIGNAALICVQDKNISDFRFKAPKEIGFDWRSGAVIICDAGGKKMPVGIFSRVVAPAPWAKTKSFRLAMAFHGWFYDFMSDTIGIDPQEKRLIDEDYACKLSRTNSYPYLIRLTRRTEGFTPLETIGHGSLVLPHMVLSSCTPFRALPEDMTKNKNYLMLGFNAAMPCTLWRRPTHIFQHPDCKNETLANPAKVMANDFAIWLPERRFELDTDNAYPNLWQGPNEPPMKEVVRSIIELSSRDYLGIVSHHLVVGLFSDDRVVTQQLLFNERVEFVPWKSCKNVLNTYIPNMEDIKKHFVVDKATYPVFCGISQFRFSTESSKPTADWYSGGVLMYSFLYVFEFGEEPSVVTYPVGILSRALTILTESGETKEFRVVAVLEEEFYKFFKSTEEKIIKLIAKGGQSPITLTGGIFMFSVLAVMLSST